MEYRENRRTGEKISIIGLGTSSIPQASEKEAIETLREAFDNGINYYDLVIAGDKLAVDHYKNLEKNAKDCISCIRQLRKEEIYDI